MTSTPTNLFVYGILMRDAARRATLQDYRLDFGGFATVVEEPGGIVYGALIPDVSSGALAMYDSIEGVASGYYRRVPVTVQTVQGDEAAYVYVMNAGWLASAKASADDTMHNLIRRMHSEYEALGQPIYAHDELDYRHARWLEETAAARERSERLWYQDAKP